MRARPSGAHQTSAPEIQPITRLVVSASAQLWAERVRLRESGRAPSGWSSTSRKRVGIALPLLRTDAPCAPRPGPRTAWRLAAAGAAIGPCATWLLLVPGESSTALTRSPAASLTRCAVRRRSLCSHRRRRVLARRSGGATGHPTEGHR